MNKSLHKIIEERAEDAENRLHNTLITKFTVKEAEEIVEDLKLHSHSTLILVIESLIAEYESKKYTFHMVDWGDGISSEEPVEGDGKICLSEAKGFNRAVDDIISSLKEELISLKENK